MRNKDIGILFVLISSAAFSSIGIFSKNLLLLNNSLSAILIFRFAISALFILPLIEFKIKFEEIKFDFFLGGFCYFITTMLYIFSVPKIGAGLATVLAYIFPIYIFIYSILKKEIKLNLKNIGIVLSCIISIIIISYSKFQKVDNIIGLCSAILCGLIYSVYILLNKKNNSKNKFNSIFYQFLGGFIFSSLLLFISDFNINFNYSSVLNILGLSIIGTIISILFLLKGIQKIGAFHVSMLSLSEPVFALIFSFLFLNEKIELIQIFGFLILFSTCFLSIKQKDKAI